MRITPDMSVGETIRRYPRSIPIFQMHHVMACCRPERPLHWAALRFGADEQALLRMLEAVARDAEGERHTPEPADG